MYKREDEKDLTMRDFQPWCMDLDRYMEENAPAREVPMTTLSVDGTEYMIPQGEEDVKATFSQLYIGYEDNMFSIMDGSRTMYENSPDSDGHATGRFRMMAVIPEDAYTLPDNRLPEKDSILAFYRKGIERPLSCGYAVTNGAMGHYTLDECHEYGEYFMLIANMQPSAELQPFFTRMGNCWRYDYVYLPNGLDMYHPEVSARLSDEGNLQLSFDNRFRADLSRFMVQCYDADYRMIGKNDDLQLVKDNWKVSIRPAGTFTWPEECCHVVLLHNLVPFTHLFIRTENGLPVSTDVTAIGEYDRYYWLGTEIGCDTAMRKRWNVIKGNRPAKETVLDFIAEHEIDDYEVIAVPLDSPDMDALECFGNLIYPGQRTERYDVEERIRTGQPAVKGCEPTPGSTTEPVRVLCVTNTHLFETEEGGKCRKAVEAFGEMEDRAVIYQDLLVGVVTSG